MIAKAYGHWPSPVGAHVLAEGLRLSECRWDTETDTVVWLEGASGFGRLMAWSIAKQSSWVIDDTIDVRAEVGYGGGDFTVASGLVYFVARKGRGLYRCSLQGGTPECIATDVGALASPIVAANGQWVICVQHVLGVDRIIALSTCGQQVRVIAAGSDFYMQPSLAVTEDLLTFVAWDHPNMPWDGTQLYVAQLDWDLGPHTKSVKRIAGSATEAIFQPTFSKNGQHLYFISDADGFGQLWVHDRSTGQSRQLTYGQADYASPAWVQGERTYCLGLDEQYVYCLRNENAQTCWVRVDVTNGTTKRMQGVNDLLALRQIACAPSGKYISLIGSAPQLSTRIQVIRVSDGASVHAVHSSATAIDADQLAQCEHISWQSGDAQVHGILFAPHSTTHQAHGKPPLLVMVHGGPTAQACLAWNARAQFFATRGYAVLVPNYRGSTGYGRAYMRQLDAQWGVADVEDVTTGARFLIAKGDVDASKVVILGGSAGGMTAMLAVIQFPDVWAGAVSYYGVMDLFALTQDTHKFEAHYLDGLIGALPEHMERYRNRSPLTHADKIKRPIAVFQGQDDKVVPQAQAEAIVAALQTNKVPHVYHVYENEGHGFRGADTLVHFYGAIEDFLHEYILGA